jgi:membrane-bound lytic murein transglycosylase D
LATDTIIIFDNLHLKQVSEVIGIPEKQLKDLNPQYRHQIIPKSSKGYTLKVPVEYVSEFIDLEDSIFTYKDSIYFRNNLNAQPKSYSASRYYHEPPPANYAKLYYTVKSGDNLGYIASWYNVRVSDLRYWNNIRRNIIRSGQKLVIYVPKSKLSKYKKVNAMSFAEKQKMIGKEVSTTTNKNSIPDNGTYIYYTVKEGDTLWEIAKQYPGVTDTDIMQLNNINAPGKIKPGQRIKIKPKG